MSFCEFVLFPTEFSRNEGSEYIYEGLTMCMVWGSCSCLSTMFSRCPLARVLPVRKPGFDNLQLIIRHKLADILGALTCVFLYFKPFFGLFDFGFFCDYIAEKSTLSSIYRQFFAMRSWLLLRRFSLRACRHLNPIECSILPVSRANPLVGLSRNITTFRLVLFRFLQ